MGVVLVVVALMRVMDVAGIIAMMLMGVALVRVVDVSGLVAVVLVVVALMCRVLLHRISFLKSIIGYHKPPPVVEACITKYLAKISIWAQNVNNLPPMCQPGIPGCVFVIASNTTQAPDHPCEACPRGNGEQGAVVHYYRDPGLLRKETFAYPIASSRKNCPLRHSCGSRNLETLSARLRCLGRRALDSRPRIGVRGKLHGNDGEDSLF